MTQIICTVLLPIKFSSTTSMVMVAAFGDRHLTRERVPVAAGRRVRVRQGNNIGVNLSSSLEDALPSDNEPIQYKSRSTALPDSASEFAVGSDNRRDRLHSALRAIGFDPSTLIDNPEFTGSAALRMYSSFILPKSAGALATAELPQRASVIANSIAFQVREYRSHQEEWLRNHDRSLAEADIDIKSSRHPLTIILDNIRSAHNVGNILRLAEAAGVTNVILCGITPAPPNPKILKTAVGAAEFVPLEKVGSTLEAVLELKDRGVAVWGVETTSQSKIIWKVEMPTKLAVVFGNELVGVDSQVLKECDELVCLPTHGVKNSLNVATCASVVVWEALRQWDDD